VVCMLGRVRTRDKSQTNKQMARLDRRPARPALSAIGAGTVKKGLCCVHAAELLSLQGVMKRKP
jgi:hypothetical protein